MNGKRTFFTNPKRQDDWVEPKLKKFGVISQFQKYATEKKLRFLYGTEESDKIFTTTLVKSRNPKVSYSVINKIIEMMLKKGELFEVGFIRKQGRDSRLLCFS